MKRPPAILRPGSSAARSWSRFSARPIALVALLIVATIFLIAAFAPFLSADLPFVIATDAGLTSPFVHGLTGSDVAWLALIGALVLGYLTRRCGASWSRVALVSVLVFSTGFIYSYSREPQHESRRYRVEELDRESLAAADESLARAAQNRDQAEALQVLRKTRAALSGFVTGAELLEARQLLIEDQPPESWEPALKTLTASNQLELERLQAAVYPLNRYAANQPSFAGIEKPGASEHLLGSDQNGRDLLARLIHGARVAMSIAVAATLVAAIIGIAMGLLAGWFGAAVDWLVERSAEVVLCLPVLFVLVAFAAYLPRSWRTSSLNLAIFIGLILWPNMARLVRAEVMRTKSLGFIQAALSLGLSKRRVFLRHLLPNVLGPVLIAATMAAGQVILIEAALSFLGLGQTDSPSWGRILAESREAVLLDSAWHLAVFPGLPLTALVLALNVLGDQIRDAIDPRSES